MKALPTAFVPRLLDGRYALLRQLGAGSAGSVYEAEDLLTAERVAVKLLSPALATIPSVRARFMAEGRAAARIAHDNVVGVIDLGFAHDTTPYIVMELAQGDTLEQLLEAEGALSVALACEIGLQVLAGLSAAHSSGIVHRDLKPANVIVHRDSGDRVRVKVLDFGIAQDLCDGGSEAIASGTLLGTPAYMAPEQALGRSVDASADVYAVCAMLYEVVSGRRAFEGEDANHVLTRVVCSDFVPLGELDTELPAPLVAAIDAGLAFDPELRISSDELARVLALLAGGAPVRSLAPIPRSSRPPVGQRPPMMSEEELSEPRIPRSPIAPGDAAVLEALAPDEPHITPSEHVRRRATTLPAEASKPPRRERAKKELFVLAAGFAAGLVLAWASSGF